MGHIARRGSLDMKTLREAIVYGNILGSFIVQEFSVDSLLKLTLDDVENRYKDYREIVSY